MHARPRRRHSANAAARCRPDEAHALTPGRAGEMSTLCRRMSPRVLRPRTVCVRSGACAVKHSAVRRAALRQAARSRVMSLRGFLGAARAWRRQNIRKQVPARAALRRQRRRGVGATLRVARATDIWFDTRGRMVRGPRVRYVKRAARGAVLAAAQCLAHACAFGQRFSCAERARQRKAAEQQCSAGLWLPRVSSPANPLRSRQLTSWLVQRVLVARFVSPVGR